MTVFPLPAAAGLCLFGLVSIAHGADPSEDLFDLETLSVKITESLPYLEVPHAGETVLLMRRQDPGATVDEPYDKTARPCPPYCVQPMRLASGVETLGELEVIDYVRRVAAGDPDVMLIDSRTAEWVRRGTIPGAVHIPYTRLDPQFASPQQIADTLQLEFGAVSSDGLWNFEGVKTLVFFCNGAWCGQSPTNIKALLGYGYPADRLKWYRGGMQAWEALGLTTVELPGLADDSQRTDTQR